MRSSERSTPDPLAILRRRLRTLVRVTPAPLRHRLIEEMAHALGDTALRFPRSARSLCACGYRLHPNARQREVVLYELEYSAGWQDAQIDLDRDGQALASCATDHQDRHTVAFACPACMRLYALPTEIELTYS